MVLRTLGKYQVPVSTVLGRRSDVLAASETGTVTIFSNERGTAHVIMVPERNHYVGRIMITYHL